MHLPNACARVLSPALAPAASRPLEVKAAIRSHSGALLYAAPELRADREVVLLAISQSGGALQFAAEVRRGTRENT